ncbi:MAG: hypothetical protein DMF86_16325 [Acidobacteria bacterium]|nr:MAG: hypothetical protein DMF86_16325 [Acidobacteriota bacterium]
MNHRGNGDNRDDKDLTRVFFSAISVISVVNHVPPTFLTIGAIVLGVSASAGAETKRYTAERFDVAARMLPAGSVNVTETIRFRFDEGTFSRVWREIPRRHTDGIAVVDVRLDGQRFEPGAGPGQFSVSGTPQTRVEWHFQPTGPGGHTFQLRYTLAGAVRQSDAGDLFLWQALPTEHAYPIDASRIAIDFAAPPAGVPLITASRVAAHEQTLTGRHLEVTATGIRRASRMAGTGTARAHARAALGRGRLCGVLRVRGRAARRAPGLRRAAAGACRARRAGAARADAAGARRCAPHEGARRAVAGDGSAR